MEDEIETIGKVADAANEAAKTTGKAIDATSGFGNWLDGAFGDLIRDGVGLYADRLRFHREEQRVDLRERHEQKLVARRVKRLRAIKPKVLLPILEYASVEDDETLRDLWASLLTSARDADADEVHTNYVSILSELTPNDAKVLAEIAERWPSAVKPLPPLSNSSQSAPYLDEKAIGFPNFESIEESLTNLERQSLIREANHLQDVLVPTSFDERLREPLEVGKFSVQVRVGLRVCAVTALGEGFLKAVIPPDKS